MRVGSKRRAAEASPVLQWETAMNKKIRKLTLARESVHPLSDLGEVAGGPPTIRCTPKTEDLACQISQIPAITCAV